MGPIIPLSNISEEVNLLVAFLIGIGFGFSLEQAGFSSSRKLAGMFYGYDITVLKVFFTAAIFAMLGLLLLNYLGFMDMSIVYVNEYFVKSAIVGGMIMGAGFIIGGFCPGTSVTAAAIGKVDAIYFILGSLIGIFIFGEAFPFLESFYKASYLGPVKFSDFIGVSDGMMAFIVVIIAMFMFWLGEKAEKRFKREDITKEV